MSEILNLIGEIGFPIAMALFGGLIIFLTLKYILDYVIEQLNIIHGIVNQLDNQVKTMNHDMIRIALTMSNILSLQPDLEKIIRADVKEDKKKD